MPGSSIATLSDGRLYALHNAYALDGRVSSYPSGARGWAASNCYLLRQDDGALLLDTGFAAHGGAILRQLDCLIERTMPLSIMPLRINEFMSVGNAMPIAGQFNVVECFSNVTDVELWLDFDSDTYREARQPAPFRTTILSGPQRLKVGGGESRLVDVYLAPVRLIGTQWTYDAATRTLFTSDTFAWVWRDDPDGPWAVGDNDDTTTPEDVRNFLFNTRYWWLEGALTEQMRRDLARVFETHDIETIAPGYGSILKGRKVVERHYAMLDGALRDWDRSRTRPHYVGRGEQR